MNPVDRKAPFDTVCPRNLVLKKRPRPPFSPIPSPARRPRIKVYCANCKARKDPARGHGYKAHNCKDCEYEEPRTSPPRPYSKCRPCEISPVKLARIYCQGCSDRKKGGGANGSSRKNARHKCGECHKKRAAVRREAGGVAGGEAEAGGGGEGPSQEGSSQEGHGLDLESVARPGANLTIMLSQAFTLDGEPVADQQQSASDWTDWVDWSMA